MQGHGVIGMPENSTVFVKVYAKTNPESPRQEFMMSVPVEQNAYWITDNPRDVDWISPGDVVRCRRDQTGQLEVVEIIGWMGSGEVVIDPATN